MELARETIGAVTVTTERAAHHLTVWPYRTLVLGGPWCGYGIEHRGVRTERGYASRPAADKGHAATVRKVKRIMGVPT